VVARREGASASVVCPQGDESCETASGPTTLTASPTSVTYFTAPCSHTKSQAQTRHDDNVGQTKHPLSQTQCSGLSLVHHFHFGDNVGLSVHTHNVMQLRPQHSSQSALLHKLWQCVMPEAKCSAAHLSLAVCVCGPGSEAHA